MADNVVSLAAAISTGDWSHFSAYYYDRSHTFKIQVHDFDRFTTTRSKRAKAGGGNLWQLSLSVVNLDRIECIPYEITELLTLVDSEGYEFRPYHDPKHEEDLEVGPGRFAAHSGPRPLPPKIPIKGAILFLLPDEPSEYAITARDRRIS